MTLPCYPCPYNSACCRWGTWLLEDEGENLLTEFGDEYVFLDTDTGVYRTQVKNGRCMFISNNSCLIHDHANYPTACKDFPWKDRRDPLAPRCFDAVTCPHIKIDD